MKNRAPRSLTSRRKLSALLLGSLTLPYVAPSLIAASGTWIGNSSVSPLLWSDAANWSPGPAPGATSGTSNSETATFNSGANTITIDANRNLRTITFDTNAGAFTLGSAGANAGNTLILSSSATAQIASTFAGTATKQTINAPLQLMGGATFSNGSLEYSNALNFAGNISAGTSSAVTLTLGGANTGDNVVSGVISNGSSSAVSISKGGGAWTLSGANTFTGTTSITGGVLKITSDASLGTAPSSATAGKITISGSAAVNSILATGSSFTLDKNRGITLGTATTTTGGSISVMDGATLTYDGVIAPTGTTNTFNKFGTGTLKLGGANTYGGITQISQGTLKLDFTASGAPSNNILSSGGALTLGASVASSSTLAITGSTTNTQTLGTVSYATGAGHINLTPGTGTLTLALGSLGGHGTGQTLDISLPANAVVTTTSTNTNMTGSLVPMLANVVTINGTDFATINGSSQVVALDPSKYTANTASSLGGTGAIVDMTTANTTHSTTVTLGDLRFNTPQATTVTLASGAAVNIGGGNTVPGMILVTSNMGSNNALITGNGMLGGISSRDFVVIQNNTAGYLQIDPTINDFNQNTSGFTKSGAGKVILTGTNAYQGVSTINEGTVVVAGDNVAASSQTISTTSGNNTITVPDASNLFVGERISGTGITSGTYIKSISGNTITMTGNAGATGTATITFLGGGALGINTAGTSAGSQVQVANGATLQIGNGGTKGALFTGQAISNYGTVALNRSDDFTFSNVITNNHAGNTLGAGALNKMGSNTASIDVLNSYLGATTISGGTLSVGGGSTASASSLAGSTTNGSNVITGLSSTAGLVVGQSVTGTGVPAGAVITAINSGTSVTISINPTSTASNTYTFYSGSPLGNGGVSSAIGRSSNDAANLVLDSGTLKYTGAAASTDRLFTVTQNGGGLDASGASNAAVNFTNTGAVAFSGSGARTLTLSGSSTGNNTLSAVIGNGSGGATSLTKSGAGKWVLNGANTYTGNTTISAGTLALGANGSIAGSAVINLGTFASQGTLDLTAKTGGFTIGSGQTLAGFGSVNLGSATLTIGSGATLAPGNSPGIVNVTGNLSLDGGSATTMEIAGVATDGNASTGFDRVIVSGSASFGGSLSIVAYNGYGLGTTAASYDLFDFAGASISHFGSVTVASTALTGNAGLWTGSTGGYTYSFDESSGVLTVAAGAIPEPATAAALLGLAALCGAGARRRVKRA